MFEAVMITFDKEVSKQHKQKQLIILMNMLSKKNT